MFIVIGDSYASSPPGCADGGVSEKSGLHGVRGVTGVYRERLRQGCGRKTNTVVGNLKPKDMVGAPWMLALALRDDGWWLRDEIIWHKSATTPFPATDRTVRAHEQVFLLAKRARYYFDWEAIAEPSVRSSSGNTERKFGDDVDRPGSHFGRSIPWEGDTRRARSVWTINPEPTREDHYAAYPTELARRLIAAGSRPGDVVLDPFAGISRTGRAAILSGRRYIGIDLSSKYVEASVRTCEAAVAEDQARIVEVRDDLVRKGFVAKAEARKFEQIGMLFGDGEDPK
jgi:site-specific DNA-methyltransferase (cytosine-N4-specific)